MVTIHAITSIITTFITTTPMPDHDYHTHAIISMAITLIATTIMPDIFYTLHQNGKLLNHTPTIDKLPNHTPFFGEGYDSVVWDMRM